MTGYKTKGYTSNTMKSGYVVYQWPDEEYTQQSLFVTFVPCDNDPTVDYSLGMLVEVIDTGRFRMLNALDPEVYFI